MKFELNNKDLIWSGLSTFLKIGGNVLLIPIVLIKLPAETVGLWTVFLGVSSFVTILDFGFLSTFTRNVTYVFSGSKRLHTTGFEKANCCDEIDYSLLLGLISAMQWFYKRLALIVFIILISVGTLYVNKVIANYDNIKLDAYVAWIILCFTSTYNIYTLYFESLLLGRGYVRKSKQINIIGQLFYIAIAVILVFLNLGLLSLIISQLFSVVIIRILSYKVFYNQEIKKHFQETDVVLTKDVLKSIYPNAIKVGITSFGGYVVNKSTVLIGSLYLPLELIASYGITMQVIGVVSSIGTLFFMTYQPLIVQLRVAGEKVKLKSEYLKSKVFLLLIFIVGLILLIIIIPNLQNFIKVDTKFLDVEIALMLLIVMYLEMNHSISAGFILTKNEVPFMKASVISAISVIILLIFMLDYLEIGIFALIIAPGLTQAVYQNWKWPSVVRKDLEITIIDYAKLLNIKLKL